LRVSCRSGACCKRIRDDAGYWREIEPTSAAHSEPVSHACAPFVSRTVTRRFTIIRPDQDGMKAPFLRQPVRFSSEPSNLHLREPGFRCDAPMKPAHIIATARAASFRKDAGARRPVVCVPRAGRCSFESAQQGIDGAPGQPQGSRSSAVRGNPIPMYLSHRQFFRRNRRCSPCRRGSPSRCPGDPNAPTRGVIVISGGV